MCWKQPSSPLRFKVGLRLVLRHPDRWRGNISRMLPPRAHLCHSQEGKLNHLHSSRARLADLARVHSHQQLEGNWHLWEGFQLAAMLMLPAPCNPRRAKPATCGHAVCPPPLLYPLLTGAPRIRLRGSLSSPHLAHSSSPQCLQDTAQKIRWPSSGVTLQGTQQALPLATQV